MKTQENQTNPSLRSAPSEVSQLRNLLVEKDQIFDQFDASDRLQTFGSDAWKMRLENVQDILRYLKMYIVIYIYEAYCNIVWWMRYDVLSWR